MFTILLFNSHCPKNTYMYISCKNVTTLGMPVQRYLFVESNYFLIYCTPIKKVFFTKFRKASIRYKTFNKTVLILIINTDVIKIGLHYDPRPSFLWFIFLNKRTNLCQNLNSIQVQISNFFFQLKSHLQMFSFLIYCL